jgi:hypothetical protein
MAGLTTLPFDPLLDLPPWVGQRQATFRFDMFNGVTGQDLGTITPLRGASLTHDTARTIKRQLSMDLGEYDTSTVDPISARIRPWMVFPGGQEYPLGTFMFTDSSRQVFSSGRLASMALNDEMFLVDQQIQVGIGNPASGNAVNTMIAKVLEGLPIQFVMESSPYASAESFAAGQMRGAILQALCVSGDFFSPWFGNDSRLHFIRSFDPIDKIPEFDLDAGNQVFRANIVEQDNLLTAPNKFVVISNASPDGLTVPVVGEASVPQSAPHSEANRGFQILQVSDLQITDNAQAQAVANNLANRQTIFETVTLTTAPDPRHDSYNVIRWMGDLWLELSWSMALTEGGGMNHMMRRAYPHD